METKVGFDHSNDSYRAIYVLDYPKDQAYHIGHVVTNNCSHDTSHTLAINTEWGNKLFQVSFSICEMTSKSLEKLLNEPQLSKLSSDPCESNYFKLMDYRKAFLQEDYFKDLMRQLKDYIRSKITYSQTSPNVGIATKDEFFRDGLVAATDLLQPRDKHE